MTCWHLFRDKKNSGSGSLRLLTLLAISNRLLYFLPPNTALPRVLEGSLIMLAYLYEEIGHNNGALSHNLQGFHSTRFRVSL